MEDRGLQLFAWFDPAPVEVEAGQVAAAVSVHNAVNIEHGNHLENKVVAQNFRIQTRARQVVQNAFHHPGGSRFARMHAT